MVEIFDSFLPSYFDKEYKKPGANPDVDDVIDS